MEGIQVHNLWHLQAVVNNNKSVVVPKAPCWSKPISAAFMIHQQGTTLLRLFNLGMYIYKKPNKGK